MKTRQQIFTSLTFGVLVAFTTIACSAATKTETQTVTQSAAQSPSETTAPSPTRAESPSPPPAPAGSIDNPIAYGTSGTVGKWNLKVIGSVPNATSMVLHENQFNGQAQSWTTVRARRPPYPVRRKRT
jgi:hypothetical protein